MAEERRRHYCPTSWTEKRPGSISDFLAMRMAAFQRHGHNSSPHGSRLEGSSEILWVTSAQASTPRNQEE